MTKSLIIISILFYCLFFFSCTDNSVSNESEDNYLIPLKLNNSWTYFSEIKHEDPNLSDSEIVKSTITSLYKINNDYWYEFDWNPIMFGPFHHNYLCKKLEGLWYGNLTDEKDSVMKSFLLFKYPMNVGDEFSISTFEGWGTIKLISKNKIISINSKEYSTYHYLYVGDTTKSNGIQSIMNYFLQPKIGLIKYTWVIIKPDGVTMFNWKQELIEYNLN